jgi:hypothetical protein
MLKKKASMGHNFANPFTNPRTNTNIAQGEPFPGMGKPSFGAQDPAGPRPMGPQGGQPTLSAQAPQQPPSAFPAGYQHPRSGPLRGDQQFTPKPYGGGPVPIDMGGQEVIPGMYTMPRLEQGTSPEQMQAWSEANRAQQNPAGPRPMGPPGGAPTLSAPQNPGGPRPSRPLTTAEYLAQNPQNQSRMTPIERARQQILARGYTQTGPNTYAPEGYQDPMAPPQSPQGGYGGGYGVSQPRPQYPMQGVPQWGSF